ncbi:hypothetical protein DFH09DRAFT_1342438 [Mycena vulgaris]|nr:hypothetical protein DFH09DRAFT_1342438 [Mycena vulgaris]
MGALGDNHLVLSGDRESAGCGVCLLKKKTSFPVARTAIAFERLASPFAATEAPPPPVVLLLLQTDLNAPTSPGLLIHEDLVNFVPRAKKKVVFTTTTKHTYPPPMIIPNSVAVPKHLSTKILEKHWEWDRDETEMALIKTEVRNLVEELLDTTKSYLEQANGPLEEVFERAAQLHPILCQYKERWATRSIIMSHLKTTAAAQKSTQQAAAIANVAQTARRTRAKSPNT